ncbi:MAG TPA: M23 family metallopeptidase [Syntrophomonadaceae bacterium]|nr:M23 family metallopeptidase [Syntrophomonadaceae bacterium]
MTRKWIGSLTVAILLVMPAGSLNAALDEGNFIPCYSNLAASVGEAVCHTIQEGDTLWDICMKYHVDLEQLKEVNHLDGRNILTIGDRLQIPNGDHPVHIIKNGETLWDVAETCAVSLDELYALNPGIDAANLKVGNSLALPRSATNRISVAPQPSRGSVVNALFSWPVIGAITSAFGWRNSGFHHGLDIAAHLGDPVRAAASGSVSFTGVQGVYGKMIVIDHPGGRQTAYAHLSEIDVTKGSQVSRGQTIGKIGVTGNSTGPHLHFEVRQAKKAINPAAVLK